MATALGAMRHVRRFAWWPVRLSTGPWRFLASYTAYQMFRDPYADDEPLVRPWWETIARME